MSGKRAKQIRKNKRISKKLALLGLGLCMGAAPAAAGGEFIVGLYPHFTKPFGAAHSIENGIGGGAKLTFRPFDFLNVFAYGDYLSLSLPNVDPISLVDGGLGTGYHFALTDRIAMDFDLQLGAYNANSSGSKLSGVTGGVSLTFTYKFNPSMGLDVQASGSHYASGSSPLMTLNAGVSPGLSINLTQLFSNKSKVSMEDHELAPVFPVLYSWYEDNSFGKVNVRNNEDSAITDITVSFYQPQYMGHPKECGKLGSLKKGESADFDLYAFFNEQMLELTEKTDTHASVIVSYSCLGQKKSQVFSLVVPVYGRNNMSWDDDRRAAVFVSSKDPAAMLFAKYITSVVRDNVRNGVPGNLQYAMGIFEALDQFGLSYVIDPSSAFEDNVGTSSIDFLQFPYQTLMYRGGDCDDISILVCSLFEAVGIRTAFITIPGHIFMAFDSGLTVAQAERELPNLNEMIVDGNEVWVPLEITLSDEGFYKAWKVGAREWNTAARAGTAALYKMEDSWKLYAPVSVPGASAYFTMPDRGIVSKLFDHSVDQWITKQIEPQIAMYEAKLSVKDDVKTRNSLGILYGRYGLFVQADEQFKKARRQGYTPSVLNTGNVYFSMKDYERASRWYKTVLKDDPENVLALIGVARCAYELSNYDECDAAYDKVTAMNPELAAEYAYLGTFVSNKGRAFSLSDRLQHTIWDEEKDEVSQTLKEAVAAVQEEEPQQIIKEEPLSDSDLEDFFDFSIDAIAYAPQTEIEDEEELEDYDIAGAAGDGDKDPDEEIDNAENDLEIADVELEIDLSTFTKDFTGLASEVALDVSDFIYEDFIEETTVAAEPVEAPQIAEATPVVAEPVEAPQTAEETPAVAELVEAPQTAEETLVVAEPVEAPQIAEQTPVVAEPVEAPQIAEQTPAVAEPVEAPQIAEQTPVAAEPVEAPQIAEQTLVVAELVEAPEITIVPAAVVMETEIIPVEVPRFTEQPSAQWAPEEAYLADTIPGMKSFEEEMGEYQNDKAFLYEETASLQVDPDNDTDEPELQKNDEQFAMAGVPDVNPFSSYLSKEDAKIVEKITNYKFEEKAPVITEETPVVVEQAVVVAEPVEAPRSTEETSAVAEPVEAPHHAEETPAVAESVEAPQHAEETTVVAEPVGAPQRAEETPAVAEPVEAPQRAEQTAVVAEPVEAPQRAEETPVVAEPVEAPQRAEELTNKAQNTRNPKGLLALASAIVAAGGIGIVASKKSRKKKDRK